MVLKLQEAEGQALWPSVLSLYLRTSPGPLLIQCPPGKGEDDSQSVDLPHGFVGSKSKRHGAGFSSGEWPMKNSRVCIKESTR